jgi:hypothetical protein
MSLDFPNTCPAIDKGIKHVKASLYDRIDSIADEILPLWIDSHTNDRFKKIDDWADSLYNDIVGPLVEECRELNSKMRDQATRQIDQLNAETEQLRQERDELQERVQDFIDRG